jgi:membrane-bound lytic murein transglycosylase B
MPSPAPSPTPPDPTGHLATGHDDPIRAPGVAALLRRNPQNVRRGAIATIASGAVLFVIASFTAPLAGADTGAAAAVVAPARSAPVTIDPSVLAAQANPVPAAPAAGKKHRAKPAQRPAPATSAVISGLAANGIPTVALNAYRVAAARMANIEPGCGIDWALLAGIGREESDHGRFAGAVLHADGTTSPHIIGVALNGVGNELIPAPPNGPELDGDATYTHALGPMQFIPQTWAGYGADANGDGVADIFNVNDAALGAARYLCAAGGNLRTPTGQVAAVLAYNHSDQYLGQVLALADAYRRGVAISGSPVGNLTGALPPVHNTGPLPPASPGTPTAADKNTPARPKPGAAKSGAPSPRPGARAPASPTATKPGSTTTGPSSPSSVTTGPASSTTPAAALPVGPTASGSAGGTSSSPAQPASTPPSPSKSCDQLSHLLHVC